MVKSTLTLVTFQLFCLGKYMKELAIQTIGQSELVRLTSLFRV